MPPGKGTHVEVCTLSSSVYVEKRRLVETYRVGNKTLDREGRKKGQNEKGTI